MSLNSSCTARSTGFSNIRAVSRSCINARTISVVFFEDKGLERSQQMFTDLNKHAVRTSNSLSTLYDSRDEFAVITKQVIAEIPFFQKYTDKEKDNLGKNSSKIFTLTNIYKANKNILHGKNRFSGCRR